MITHRTMDLFYRPNYGYEPELDSDDDDAIRIDGQPSSDEEDMFEGDSAIRKFLKEYERGENESPHNRDENDFEKELEAELESRVADLERRRFNTTEEEMKTGTDEATGNSSKRPTEGGSGDPGTSGRECYDDDYYDSDDDDEGKKKHPVMSNDDLLYDPDIDDDNQRWMDEQRASQRPKPKAKAKMAPNSDAMLDCPACLTTVCIDCQRHEIYPDQYRAMFVQNCTVDPQQTVPASLQNKRKRKHGRAPSGGDNDQFPAVKCTECQTVIGAIDSEEIYYFFNVVPSHT